MSTDALTPPEVRPQTPERHQAVSRHGAIRELLAELRYAAAARYYLWSGIFGALVGLMATLSLNDISRRLVSDFLGALTDAQAQGIDVGAALASAAGVETLETGVTTIDNPLRYDFDRAWNAVGMLTGPGYAANALQFSALIIVPIVAVAAGILLSVKDYRHRTIQLRAIRSSLPSIHASMVLTAASVAIAVAVASVLGALVTGAVSRDATLAGLESEFLAHSEATITFADAGLFLLLAAVTALLFAVIGVALGLVTRSMVVPMAVFTAVHLAVPMLGAWDPRRMVATLFSTTQRFEGTIDVRVPDQASLAGAVFWLGVICVVAWVAGLVALRLRPRLGAGG
ncbi:MAG: hypothetical protein Q4F65_04900 [Propionibacteriaceae bacterium]|nr:hypothetical protein [Propionibacteriaceae bacterium]